MMTEQGKKEFAEYLRQVARELGEYADSLEFGSGEWTFSTYALEAQGAVYDLMKQDGVL
jgi:hypothetical protein